MPRRSERRSLQADIFCRVVDNYGDIGVCWRLARRLAHGHGWSVRLWVDDLRTFSRLVPEVADMSGHGRIRGIDIFHWTTSPPQPCPSPGDVVIEAFACDTPPAFAARLGPRHVWLNLEYLSAEDWVASCHALPSPQPGGLTKYFFFPGFTPDTGGLLREPGLLRERDAFQASPASKAAFLAAAGVPAGPLAQALEGHADLVSVFCYRDAPLSRLHALLSARPRPAVMLLADGVAPQWHAGQHGSLHIVRLPFFEQDDYDRLLWAADINFVRGEDSFVRAQWAGRPLVWHIYPQADSAHIDKLSAWLDRYPAPPGVAALHEAWNGATSPDDVGPALAAVLHPSVLADWTRRAALWSRTLAHGPELADAISDFCAHRLECGVR